MEVDNIKEYRITTRVRNNLILERIEELGFSSISAFCRHHHLTYSLVVTFISMSKSPLNKKGAWVPQAIKLSEIFKCLPEDIFSVAQQHMEVKTKHEVKVSDAEAIYLLNQQGLIDPISLIEDGEFKKSLLTVLSTLTEREQRIIKEKYGLDDGREKTYAEVAEQEGCSLERIRQVEARALQKLRRPERSRPLKLFLTNEVFV